MANASNPDGEGVFIGVTLFRIETSSVTISRIKSMNEQIEKELVECDHQCALIYMSVGHGV